MPKFDEQKSLFMSLLYLQSEAKCLKMSETEACLKNTIEAVFSDMDSHKEETEQLTIIKSFIDKAMAMPSDNLRDLVSTLELFDSATVQ